MAVFAGTILLSAFLLFQVQPLIAKIMLPWFGGSAAVWSAALLFFQMFLLGGYAYAHFLINRFKPRVQMLVHVGLLVASCALLPIIPAASWKPTTASDPTLRILALLTVTVGLPYFLLSSTSPLLQAWYVRRTGSTVPYRLFALSNFGSMLGLLSFPFLVEPNFTSRQSAYGWSGIYIGFVALCALAAWVSRRGATLPGGIMPIQGASMDEPPEPPAPPSGPPGARDLVLWISLAAVASTLLVAVTTHLTQNVAPIPLLWVVPLALYLLTFILAFEGGRLYQRSIFVPLLTPALAMMAYFVFNKNVSTAWLLPTFTLGLFVCCMVCHGELAVRRPAPEHLTLFYLMVSVGGAIGGMFVAIIAPRVFDSYLELPLGLVACAVLMWIVLRNVHVPRIRKDTLGLALFFGVCVTVGFLVREQYQVSSAGTKPFRNFYGALSVSDDGDAPADQRARRLYHGTIEHGSQLLDERYRYEATSYYGTNSGVGRAIRALQSKDDDARIGVIGLGAGVLSTYGRPDDSFTFYEINPIVERLAREEFTFYDHTRADKRVVLGDARLVLERTEPQKFDLLVVDAFSGDAIPVHLLTEEAFALYFRHLKGDGILALHVSNRYVDLVPVAARGVEKAGKPSIVVSDSSGPYTEDSDWVLATSDTELLDDRAFDGAEPRPVTAPPGFRGWTDSYSNIFQVLLLNR